MATPIGDSGAYPKQQSIRRFRWIFVTLMAAVFIFGIVLGYYLRVLDWRFAIGGVAVVALVYCTVFRLTEAFGREAMNYKRGGEGEDLVLRELSHLPERYYIINGISLPNDGDIDHLVIGPTGVFCIDTKDWRGYVESTEDGELTINGQRTDKRQLARFIGRVMRLKDAIAQDIDNDLFFQAVFVFPKASVQAKLGTTKQLHCMKDEQLVEYIENRKGRKLSQGIIDALAEQAKVIHGNAN